MEDFKGSWYPDVRPFSKDHLEDARKSIEDKEKEKSFALGQQVGKSDDQLETLQKRMKMDLFK